MPFSSRKIRVRLTQLNIEAPPPVTYYAGSWAEAYRNAPHDGVRSINFRGVVEYSDFHRVRELQDMMHGELYLTDDIPIKVVPSKKPSASILRFLK